MTLTMIAAIGQNRELGKNNDLIWHLPSDLKFFKEQTKEHSIVMGRKTFESLPGLLPKRHHIVISRCNPTVDDGVEVFDSIKTFIDAYKDVDEEIFVIGGAQIYKEMLPYANRLLLTEIEKDYDADVFFPDFNKNKYTRNELAEVFEKNTHYKHVEYVREVI